MSVGFKSCFDLLGVNNIVNNSVINTTRVLKCAYFLSEALHFNLYWGLLVASFALCELVNYFTSQPI